MAEPSLRLFRPSAANPWDAAKAAHLLHRAGLGGQPEEVERLVGLGLEAAVEELLNYARLPDLSQGVDFSELRQAYADAFALRRSGGSEQARRDLRIRINRLQREKLQEVRVWWMARLVATPRPLQEKMVLFWHGLLVSGFPGVQNPEFLYIQNHLFRRQATGNFKQLILEVSRDPAMLTYLDNNSNRKGKPNENYARELLELFTLGVGQYTEEDIKEAARAFTGWTLRPTPTGEFEFFFDAAQHDHGPKTFLGRRGAFDGAEIIDIIFEHPAAARWLPRRLFEYLVYLQPEEHLVDELARVFRRGNFEVRPLLRALLTSEVFYSPRARRSQVKSPVELVVGTARALRIPPAAAPALLLAADRMGQMLLMPPNVGGWPKGRAWVTTATILERYNFSSLVTEGRMPGLPPRLLEAIRPVDVAGLVPPTARTAGEVLAAILGRLLPGAVIDQKRQFALWRALGANRAADPVEATPRRVRSVLHLLMSMPEYQLT